MGKEVGFRKTRHTHWFTRYADRSPCMAFRFRFCQDVAESAYKMIPVSIGCENFQPFDSPDNDMMQSPRSIYS